MLPESYYGWCGGSDSCGYSEARVAITLDRWEETGHEILTKGCHQRPCHHVCTGLLLDTFGNGL